MTTRPLQNKHIGHRIQHARIGSSVTLSDLAQHTGIDAQQLQAFETDQDLITVIELLEIADALALPVEYFMQVEAHVNGLEKWRLFRSYQQLNPQEREHALQLLAAIARGNIAACGCLYRCE